MFISLITPFAITFSQTITNEFPGPWNLLSPSPCRPNLNFHSYLHLVKLGNTFWKNHFCKIHWDGDDWGHRMLKKTNQIFRSMKSVAQDEMWDQCFHWFLCELTHQNFSLPWSSLSSSTTYRQPNLDAFKRPRMYVCPAHWCWHLFNNCFNTDHWPLV